MIQPVTATPIHLIPTANGRRMSNISEKLITASISIATSGILFCCGFMWKTNASQARMEQHLIETDKEINDLQIKMNNVQLKVMDINGNVIELKTLINKK